MNLVGVYIVACYVAIIPAVGPWGLLAAAAHVAVLLLTVPRQ